MAGPGSFTDNDYCFACGSKNPLGLHLTFFREGETLCTRVVPPPHWQGFDGVLHGGLQSTIMDDLMSNYLFRVRQVWATTAELACRFRKPVPTGRELLFEAHAKQHTGRIWVVTGTCKLADNQDQAPLTTAQGRFVEVLPPESC